jgi:hypothetical protein
MYAVELRAPAARKRERCAGRLSRPASSRDERQRTRSSAVAAPRDSPSDLHC